MRHLILNALALAACTLFVSVAGAQVIKLEPISHDFGSMQQQEDRKTETTVTNMGDKVLVIEDIRVDCGCTVPTLTKNELAPGESTTIEINFNSKKFHGKVFKSVQVYSNDPQNTVVDFMLTADIHTPLIIDPASQTFGFTTVLRGETMSKPITLEATQVDELKLTVDKTRNDYYKVKAVHNVDGNPKKAQVVVTLPADIPAGKIRDHLRIETNVPEMPTVDFQIQSLIERELKIAPPRINLRYKKTFNEQLRLAPFREPLEFKILKAECDLPGIELIVEERIPNRETIIRVNGKPVRSDDARSIAQRGRMEGTITIHTDLPDTPLIEVPVSYMVRK